MPPFDHVANWPLSLALGLHLEITLTDSCALS